MRFRPSIILDVLALLRLQHKLDELDRKVTELEALHMERALQKRDDQPDPTEEPT